MNKFDKDQQAARLADPPPGHSPNPFTNVLEIIDRSFLGGGQRHVYWITRDLNRTKNYRIMIACAPGGELWEVFHKTAWKMLPVRLKYVTAPGQLHKLYRFIKEHRVQVVHTHGGVAGLWGRLTAFLAGVPVVVHTLHGIHFINYSNFISRKLGIFLERVLSRITFRTIYVSETNFRAGQRYRLSRPEKSVLVRNAVDDISKLAVPEKTKPELFDVPESSLIIGCIARLDPVKGHIFLLSAFENLAREFPDLFLILVGSGPEESRLREWLADREWKHRVRFLGNRTDIPVILPRLDILVLPSLWEGLSLTLLEAMAASRPIVASRTEGIVDLLTDRRSALLVPPGEAEPLAAALRELIEDAKLRGNLGEQARQAFLEQNDMQKMIRQIDEIYQAGLVGRGRRKA